MGNIVRGYALAIPMLRTKVVPGYKVITIDGETSMCTFFPAENYASSLALNYSGSWSLRDKCMKA